MPTTAERPRTRPLAFEGLPPAAFAFFAALAEDNTRPWFLAHAETYRTCVDRPWRALVGSVAERLGRVLPDLDTEVKTGHVLSRINLQWPRPGAAYRTGLRATFAVPAPGRRPGASLLLTLDASGVRAGAEVAAGTDEWARVLERLQDGGPTPEAVWEGALRWSVAGESIDPADTAALAGRMRAVRRAGALRWSADWGDGEAVVETPAFAECVWAAVRDAIPLYLCAHGVAHPGTIAEAVEWMAAAIARGEADGRGDDPGRVPAHRDLPVPAGRLGPESEGAGRPTTEGDTDTVPALDPRDAGVGPVESGAPLLLPPLPVSLRRALGARADREGVSVEAFILFALTQAAGGVG